MDNAENTFIPFTGNEPRKTGAGASVCNTKTMDTGTIFTKLMTKETVVNNVSLQIQSF
jgi:hypothetical protein